MNKLIRLTVIIAILSLTSFKSFSQTWGPVLNSSTTQLNGLIKAAGGSIPGSVYQLTSGGAAYTTSSVDGGGSLTTYYFVFNNAGSLTYYSYTTYVGGLGGTALSSSTPISYTGGGYVTDATGVPLDGGVSLLLVGGVALHLRRKKQLAINSEKA
jgi:hypothetical protein